MTATIFLIRHAAHADVGERLSGRGPENGLTAAGRDQADRLGRQLAYLPLRAIHSSPRQRTSQTAEAVARSHKLPVQEAEALDELDFGEWTGRRFDELGPDPQWQRWNDQRSTARTPGGESMAEAQTRAVDYVRIVASSNPGAQVALVSHCDIIRAIIADTLGLSLDRLLSFDVDPASVSRLEVGEWGSRLSSVNERLAA